MKRKCSEFLISSVLAKITNEPIISPPRPSEESKSLITGNNVKKSKIKKKIKEGEIKEKQ